MHILLTSKCAFSCMCLCARVHMVVLVRVCVHTFYVCVCSNYTKCWNYTSDEGAMNVSMVSLPAFPFPLYSACAHPSTHFGPVHCLSKRPREYLGTKAWARNQNPKHMTEDNQGIRDHLPVYISKSGMCARERASRGPSQGVSEQ